MSDDTVAELLARAFALPEPDKVTPFDVPPGTRCSITGAPIARGYRVRDLLQRSTAVILDTVRGDPDGYLSDAAARCWQSVGPGKPLMRGGLAFEDGTVYQPRIALAGRLDGRGCWRDVLRAVWPARRGQRLVMILTTDTKKRLWTSARIGPLGEVAPVLVCDGDTQGVLTVSWPKLLACLTTVEAVYALGFVKPTIAAGLLGHWPSVEAWGIATALLLDRAVAPWRGTPELTVALLVAQRPHGVVDPPPSLPAVRSAAPAAPAVQTPAAVSTNERLAQGALF